MIKKVSSNCHDYTSFKLLKVVAKNDWNSVFGKRWHKIMCYVDKMYVRE